MNLSFCKMNGAGNDFVVLDGREQPIQLTAEQVRRIAARENNPVTEGCDQVIVMEPSSEADVFMRIYNADGGEVDACGNATRCVGWLLTGEHNADATVQTKAGILHCKHVAERTVKVNMGKPRLEWRDIPLAREVDTLYLPLSLGPLHDGVAVSMGNPHAVFFVNDVKAIDLANFGPTLEYDGLFPKRANISIVQIDVPGHLWLRTWERGVGLTKACGTAACAAFVAARLRGLAGSGAVIHAEGGELDTQWSDEGEIWLMGAVQMEYRRTLNL